MKYFCGECTKFKKCSCPTLDGACTNFEINLKLVIGYNITRIRRVLGYNRQKVADAIGLSYDIYRRLEYGQGDFSIQKIQKVADFFNIDIKDLMEF